MEIEKKYLLSNIPEDLIIEKTFLIEQYYLMVHGNRALRIRRMDDEYFVTIKISNNIQRFEKEIPITAIDFEELKQFGLDKKILKKRHIVQWDKYKIELDEFLDNLKGLFIAEVEFSSVEELQQFQPPLWFGKDVSLDYRYTNAYLSEIQTIPT